MTPFKGENISKYQASLFGQRISPISKKPENHKGQDSTTVGTWPGTAWNVRECTGGTVVNVSEDKWRGKFVDVRTSTTHVERYQHMHEIYVRVGQKVPQGTVLGMAGKTGDVTGVHLHFEVLKTNANSISAVNNAQAVNPSLWSDVPNTVGNHPGNNNIDGAAPPAPSDADKKLAIAEAGLVQAKKSTEQSLRDIEQTLTAIKEA